MAKRHFSRVQPGTLTTTIIYMLSSIHKALRTRCSTNSRKRQCKNIKEPLKLKTFILLHEVHRVGHAGSQYLELYGPSASVFTQSNVPSLEQVARVRRYTIPCYFIPASHTYTSNKENCNTHTHTHT